ncbi:RluA family pseudouridine synthase [Desulfogranum marinum]|uniref:RluA family pseudouridine synthase n=1 Tax=Desulfogranum marinum TaxID=453220 RepID=UPI0019666D01|nr:RluA family pseudouridine synthase [Desulfogranum marinum]MBM9510844.1 RluA family pseudouridine synthase [Desulfogranum marinum]
MDQRNFQHVVQPVEEKQRLDHYLVRKYPDFSRSYINKLILSHHVVVGGKAVKAGHKVRSGEMIDIHIPPLAQSELQPEDIAFETLFEDEHLLVISKPPGLVVHPAAGHHSGTLVNGLLYRYRNLPQLDGGRPGIVHRLDKDTSGVMLVAKTEMSLRRLAESFKERQIHKIYYAVLLRYPGDEDGRIIAPIGRHPANRKKMSIRPIKGRYAVSQWHIIERYGNGMCLAEITIETGRTHQIRVHMASVKAPVAGDELYGGKIGVHTPGMPCRQMLHASCIQFNHPVSLEPMQFLAPLWPDMEEVVQTLRGLDV